MCEFVRNQNFNFLDHKINLPKSNWVNIVKYIVFDKIGQLSFISIKHSNLKQQFFYLKIFDVFQFETQSKMSSQYSLIQKRLSGCSQQMTNWKEIEIEREREREREREKYIENEWTKEKKKERTKNFAFYICSSKKS